MKRKKITVRVIFAFFLLLGGLLVLMMFNLNSLVSYIKPELVEYLSKKVGKKIAINEIRSKAFPHPSIELVGFSIEGESKAPEEKSNFGTLSLRVNLADILKRKITVSEISLKNGNLIIIKRKNGDLEVGGISLNNKPKSVPPETEHPQTGAPNVSISQPPPTPNEGKSFSLSLASINIEEFQVTLIDQTNKVPSAVKIGNLSGNLANIGSTEKSTFALTASLLTKEKSNVSFTGSYKPSSSTLPQVELAYELTRIDMEGLGRLLSSYADTSKLKLTGEGGVSGKLNISDNTLFVKPLLTLSQAGIDFDKKFSKDPGLALQLSSELELFLDNKRGNFKNTELRLGNSKLTSSGSFSQPATFECEVKGSDISLADVAQALPPLAAQSPGGNLTLSLNLEKSGAKAIPNALLNFKGSSISITPPAAKKLELKSIEGNVKSVSEKNSGSADIRCEKANLQILQFEKANILANFSLPGTNPSDALSSSLTLEIGEGHFADINILKSVFSKLEEVPIVGQTVRSALGPDLQKLVSGEDTAFDSCQANLRVAGNAVQIERFLLNHPVYKVTATGPGMIGGDIQMNAKFILAAEPSSSLVASQAKLKLLLDPDGTVVVPLQILKDVRGVKVMPDVRDLGERAGKNALKYEGKKALEKVAPGLGSALESIFR